MAGALTRSHVPRKVDNATWKMDSPDLPIPISYISGNYYLFSIDAVTYLRREHHICGVLTGTLPQIPQQNVFLGLPLELMPEEARLLAEKGVATIVDEAEAQAAGMKKLADKDRELYLQDLKAQGARAMRLQVSRKERRREEALKRLDGEKKKNGRAIVKDTEKEDEEEQEDVDMRQDATGLELFSREPHPERTSRAASINETTAVVGITPPTSCPPLPYRPSPEILLPLPKVPSSYPLFAHLHSEGYFLSPGIRFGCQYLAYPGDPLRFHSHFLVVSAEWDEELDLMLIIAGGRLGTGVKKGFLLGGAEEQPGHAAGSKCTDAQVRTFSIEWAGM